MLSLISASASGSGYDSLKGRESHLLLALVNNLFRPYAFSLLWAYSKPGFCAGTTSLSAQLADIDEAISETNAKIATAEAVGDRYLHLLHLAERVELRKKRDLLEQQKLLGEYDSARIWTPPLLMLLQNMGPLAAGRVSCSIITIFARMRSLCFGLTASRAVVQG